MGKLVYMNKQGDSTHEWTQDDPASVKLARDLVHVAKQHRAALFAVYDKRQPAELVTDFDPTATEFLIVPQIAGG